jgi:hypothetical protein
MFTSTSQSPPPSPRTINDLPVELKKYIVELAAKQDEVYEQWTTEFRIGLHDEMKDVLERQKKRYRSRLGALFCTSKLWSELVAPLRFKVRFCSFLLLSRADFPRYF